jgi:hypothetical protein
MPGKVPSSLLGCPAASRGEASLKSSRIRTGGQILSLIPDRGVGLRILFFSVAHKNYGDVSPPMMQTI